MLLELHRIRIDGETQSRAQLSHEVVEEYTAAMEEGVVFPPAVVFFDGGDYWLADGFHRYWGAKHAGLDEIAVDVHNGTQLDAQLYSFGANKGHGLRLSNADKRKAVTGALQHPVSGKWSDRQIAKHCGVHHELVGKVRQELSGGNRQIDQQRTVTRNGTTYQQNTANIGKSPAAPAAREPQAEAAHKPLRDIASPTASQQDGEGARPASAPSRTADAPDLAAEAEEAAPAYSALDEAHDTIADLRAELALVSMRDVPESERGRAQELIAGLQAEVKSLAAQLRATAAARDALLHENAQMKRQMAGQRKEIERLRAATV